MVVNGTVVKDTVVKDTVVKDTAGKVPGNECRECLAGQPHCHGTLIRHHGVHRQCTEADCAHPEVLMHALEVDCEAIGCECGDRGERRLAI
jgi:hypothetical protein